MRLLVLYAIVSVTLVCGVLGQGQRRRRPLPPKRVRDCGAWEDVSALLGSCDVPEHKTPTCSNDTCPVAVYHPVESKLVVDGKCCQLLCNTTVTAIRCSRKQCTAQESKNETTQCPDRTGPTRCLPALGHFFTVPMKCEGEVLPLKIPVCCECQCLRRRVAPGIGQRPINVGKRPQNGGQRLQNGGQRPQNGGQRSPYGGPRGPMRRKAQRVAGVKDL